MNHPYLIGQGTESVIQQKLLEPHKFEHRVLLMLCGLTPQVVTETVYALSVGQSPAFIPTQIRLITTKRGAENAVSSLLEGDKWLLRLREDYQLPEIKFSEEAIEIIKGPDGMHLEDIRTREDNEFTANQIMRSIRRLANIENSALHVSMAGGRKTMGFFAGYALSLFGRRQDRLSHVLVSTPFESNPNFFYPSPNSRLLSGLSSGKQAIDAKDAEITLANIDFVRLRKELPQEFLDAEFNWGDAITHAQNAINSATLTLDLYGGKIQAGNKVTGLPPVQLAFLSWLAKRQSEHKTWVNCPNEGAPENKHAKEYLDQYRKVVGKLGSFERTAKRLKNGMTRDFFSETKSKLGRTLRHRIGHSAAEPYLVKTEKSGKLSLYGLSLKPGSIYFEAIDDQ